MKRITTLAALALLGFTAMAQGRIEDNFLEPPRDCHPRVWWHWMNGNISKDGIKKDLEWMDRAGIAGFHNFDAGLEEWRSRSPVPRAGARPEGRG